MSGFFHTAALEKQEVKIIIEYDGRRYEFVGDVYEPDDFMLKVDRYVEHAGVTEGIMLPALTGPTELKLTARLHQGLRKHAATVRLLPSHGPGDECDPLD